MDADSDDEPQVRGSHAIASKIVWGLILLLGYPLLTGPAAWLVSRFGSLHSFEVIYMPLAYLIEVDPSGMVGRTLSWWIAHWADFIHWTALVPLFE